MEIGKLFNKMKNLCKIDLAYQTKSMSSNNSHQILNGWTTVFFLPEKSVNKGKS